MNDITSDHCKRNIAAFEKLDYTIIQHKMNLAHVLEEILIGTPILDSQEVSTRIWNHCGYLTAKSHKDLDLLGTSAILSSAGPKIEYWSCFQLL